MGITTAIGAIVVVNMTGRDARIDLSLEDITNANEMTTQSPGMRRAES